MCSKRKEFNTQRTVSIPNGQHTSVAQAGPGGPGSSRFGWSQAWGGLQAGAFSANQQTYKRKGVNDHKGTVNRAAFSDIQ